MLNIPLPYSPTHRPFDDIVGNPYPSNAVLKQVESNELHILHCFKHHDRSDKCSSCAYEQETLGGDAVDWVLRHIITHRWPKHIRKSTSLFDAAMICHTLLHKHCAMKSEALNNELQSLISTTTMQKLRQCSRECGHNAIAKE